MKPMERIILLRIAPLMVLACAVALSAVQPQRPLTPPLHTIEFNVDEGTFINVDVSPDGKTLVFDLLGDLYTLPITGGQAQPLLNGREWERCPRYSPDGQQIAFISDRSTTIGRNVDNVWVLDLSTNAL